MDPLTCAECRLPLAPHESLISRLGRLFHADCHERHLADFVSALRRSQQRAEAADASEIPPTPGVFRLIA